MGVAQPPSSSFLFIYLFIYFLGLLLFFNYFLKIFIFFIFLYCDMCQPSGGGPLVF
jgi:hypothetical protein